MQELRQPHELEKRHFCEMVTRHKATKEAKGSSATRMLKAELTRFGFVTTGGGLKVAIDAEIEQMEVDDDTVIEYLATMKRVMARR